MVQPSARLNEEGKFSRDALGRLVVVESGDFSLFQAGVGQEICKGSSFIKKGESAIRRKSHVAQLLHTTQVIDLIVYIYMVTER